ncbi:MAG: Uma2 family endonuclease [Gemmataceae bacterium]|nr:Uma2 family endonuclease [Gemmataceae bacterium]
MKTKTVYEDTDAIRMPGWVSDLESFRRWCDDDAFPDKLNIAWLKGEVWFDLSLEQIFTHNNVKGVFGVVLGGIILAQHLGRFFTDGAFLSNEDADVSNKPDFMFASAEAIRSKRFRFVEGRHEGFVEVEGTPEMVLEVVSRGSVKKDKVTLREAYAHAGIKEYWLVDCRKEPLEFDLLRLGKRGYTATRKRDGWVRSEVFDRSFRLVREEGDDGHPAFKVEAAA